MTISDKLMKEYSGLCRKSRSHEAAIPEGRTNDSNVRRPSLQCVSWDCGQGTGRKESVCLEKTSHSVTSHNMTILDINIRGT
jgi:hypothetical protein